VWVPGMIRTTSPMVTPAVFSPPSTDKQTDA
jgi:hypothetical protein